MEFIKPGTYIDFMKYRGPVITVLGLMATLSLVSLFYPGPNYGIDFAGGTEVQLAFRGTRPRPRSGRRSKMRATRVPT